MKYLVIENHGVPELGALTLMGASSKRDSDNQIGMYGTGFKNGIAILLRERIAITIFFGEERIQPETTPIKFRDKEFKRVDLVLSDRRIETSFTTDMGLQWDTDGALRELISNALDEPGPVVAEWTDEPSGIAGRTRVFVEMTESVQEFYRGIGRHFLKLREGKPCFTFDGGSIWPHFDSDKVHVYRRGVMVFQSKLKGCFDYEFDTITIDEERKASPWHADYELGHNIDKFPLAAKAQILPMLSIESFESRCSCIGGLSSEDWKTIFADRVACSASAMDGPLAPFINRDKTIRVSETWETALGGAGVKTSAQLFTRIQSAAGNIVAATDLEEKGIAWAIAFLAGRGFNITRDEIKVFVSRSNAMGEYSPSERMIYIARQCLARGRRYLLVTLLEEMAHRDCGAGDFTRAFQDYVFEQLVNSLERESGEYL